MKRVRPEKGGFLKALGGLTVALEGLILYQNCGFGSAFKSQIFHMSGVEMTSQSEATERLPVSSQQVPGFFLQAALVAADPDPVRYNLEMGLPNRKHPARSDGYNTEPIFLHPWENQSRCLDSRQIPLKGAA